MRRFLKHPFGISLLITLAGAAAMLLADTTYPDWWLGYDVVPAQPPPVANATDFAAWMKDNYAPATVGQLKYVATQAQAYLNDKLASVGGAGPDIDNVIANFTVTDPGNFQVLNLGQLKYVAKPFYDRLLAVRFDTHSDLNFRLTGNANATTWSGNYPWNDATNTSVNYAPANLGQVKFAFTFDLDNGSVGNFTPAGNLSISNSTIPDWWKVLNGLDPFAGNIDGSTDFGNGRTDLQQYQYDLAVYNGTVSGNLVGNISNFQSVFTTSSTTFPSVPGNFTGNTGLSFPRVAVPQYAILDLGNGSVIDINDEGDVLYQSSSWTFGSDSYPICTMRYNNGSSEELPHEDGVGNPIIWSRLSDDASAMGYHIYDVDFIASPVVWDGNLEYPDIGNASPQNSNPLISFTRSGDIYFEVNYIDADNSYRDYLHWYPDGTVDIIGHPILIGGLDSPNNANVEVPLAETANGDTLDYEFTNLTYTTYINPGPNNTTVTTYGLTGHDEYFALNGHAVSGNVALGVFPYFSNQSFEDILGNLSHPFVLSGSGNETLDYYNGTFHPGNLTANTNSSTPLQLRHLIANGQGITFDGQYVVNGYAAALPDLLPPGGLNPNLSLNLTGLGVNASFTTPALKFTSVNSHAVLGGEIYDSANGSAIPRAILAIPAGLAVDNNRDGNISFDVDDQTTPDRPFRFWLNDGVDQWHTVDDSVGSGYTIQDSLNPANYTGNLNYEQDYFQDDILAGNVEEAGTRNLEDFATLAIDMTGLQQVFEGNSSIYIGLKWKSVATPAVSGHPAIKLFWAGNANNGGGLNDYLSNSTVAIDEVRDANSFTNDDSSTGAIKDISGVAINATNVTVSDDKANGTLVAETANSDYDFVLPQSVFANISTNPTVYLHFEGCQRGRGELQMVILHGDGMGNFTKVADGPSLYLCLQDIKEMYERWTVGDGNGALTESAGKMTLPAFSAAPSNARLPSGVTQRFRYTPATPGLSIPGDPQGNKYILFVHGWNMEPWERDAFAETMLKRLYWQGYKGKFGAFQWPTTFGYSTTALPRSFDDGEYVAFLSAAPLVNLLNSQLRTYTGSGNLSIMAHSHGNLVVAEALRRAAQAGLGTLVNTYVAAQAAVPGESYDPSVATSSSLPFVVSNITIPGYLTAPISGNFGPNTPDIFASWIAPGNSTTAVTTKANFYNTNDWALNLWNTNEIIKPAEEPQTVTGTIAGYSGNISLWTALNSAWDAQSLTLTQMLPGNHTQLSANSSVYTEAPYGYTGNIAANATSTGFYKTQYWTSNSTATGSNVTLFLDTSNPQGNLTALPTRYEIMSYAAESRSKALGEISGNISGFSSQDLQGLWPGDPLNTTGNSSLNYDEHPWHSGEFRFDAPSQDGYWNNLMGQFGLPANH